MQTAREIQSKAAKKRISAMFSNFSDRFSIEDFKAKKDKTQLNVRQNIAPTANSSR